MDLFFYAKLPSLRRVTSKDYKAFQTMFFEPTELTQLKLMNREELLGLMAFAGIRVMNEIPIIACSEDQMRLAFCVWRGNHSKQMKEKMKKWKVGG